jgi:hypothetical protein
MPQIISEERRAYNKAYYLANKAKNTCEHNIERRKCKACGGSDICVHQKEKAQCRACGGSRFCEHNRTKATCKKCGGSQICIHNIMKAVCKQCGGSSICIHNKVKSRCKECGGSEICEHQISKFDCKVCNLMKCLVSLQRKSIRRMLISGNLTKLKPTIEYLGCSGEYFSEYLKKKMIDGMTFQNIHIDIIKPVSRFNLQNEEEFLDCCHYTNLQPLLSEDNLIKSNKWNETKEAFWIANIKGKEYLQIYNPLD